MSTKDIKQSYKTIMDDSFPDTLTISFGTTQLSYKKRSWKIEEDGILIEKGLRYGENPGQEAALYQLVNGNLTIGGCNYIEPGNALISSLTEENLIQFGKHPGKTNLTDIDNSLNILKYLTDKPTTVIVKHNNPSGVAQAGNTAESFTKALMADRVAAFGGCVALNTELDRETAQLISQNYFEVVCAPSFADGAVDILKARKNLRIVEISRMNDLASFRGSRFIDFKSLMDGGLIIQQSPLNVIKSKDDLIHAATEYKGKKYSIERMPTEAEYADMLFGWSVEQGITSNSVIYVRDGVTVGIGTGEQDRVGVAQIAVYKAYQKFADAAAFEKYGRPYNQIKLEVEKGEEDKSVIDEIDSITEDARGGIPGSCMVSDAFFPFRDGVDVGIKEGITSIIQPGGSMLDHQSIEACNEADPKVTMVYTGQRCFRH
ncbi:MAG: IMP cyclohydrolase [Spirochaetes bacterium]|nr:IMP cyclohydrolase [Spirochaetota bacterium]MBN2770708.1 IMP cyclohydrolase [Spirochaetota bacterium]